jgi:hypothetical protein
MRIPVRTRRLHRRNEKKRAFFFRPFSGLLDFGRRPGPPCRIYVVLCTIVVAMRAKPPTCTKILDRPKPELGHWRAY